jgi:hypothetical protein
VQHAAMRRKAITSHSERRIRSAHGAEIVISRLRHLEACEDDLAGTEFFASGAAKVASGRERVDVLDVAVGKGSALGCLTSSHVDMEADEVGCLGCWIDRGNGCWACCRSSGSVGRSIRRRRSRKGTSGKEGDDCVREHDVESTFQALVMVRWDATTHMFWRRSW